MKLNNQRLQILMAEQVLTVKDLSAKSGLSRVYISDCILRSPNPKPATVGKIARALNVNVQEIIENVTGAATPEINK